MSENIDYSFITNENIKFLDFFYNERFVFNDFIETKIPNVFLSK